jgi:hypothetical protein
MDAPNPIFDDWAEYPAGSRRYVFSKKRNCGLPQILTCMWVSLIAAFFMAAGLTIIILAVQ